MICSLGAGDGSKTAAMYQIKYMTKSAVDICAARSVIVDAHKHIQEFPSSAEDSGTVDRSTRHFVQRIINKSTMELEASQAACIVLQQESSTCADTLKFSSLWELRKLACIVAGGTYDDIDFTNALREDDADPNNDFLEPASEDEGHEDLLEGDFEPEDFHAPQRVHARGAENRIGVTIDLAEHLGQADGHESSTKGCTSGIYTSKGNLVAVSMAHHYAYRDPRLLIFTAYEFMRKCNIREMNPADRKWYDAKMSGESDSHERGRPCQRFLLVAPHPLCTTHLIVSNAKLGILAFAGAPPPKEPLPPSNNDTNAIARKRQQFAEFMCANFVPWSAADAKANAAAAENSGLILSYERWQSHTEQLVDEACLFRDREETETPEMSPDDRQVLHEMKCQRLIAAARLTEIENVLNGFQTKKESGRMLSRHRERMRTLWADGERPEEDKAHGDQAWRPATAAVDRLRMQVRIPHPPTPHQLEHSSSPTPKTTITLRDEP